jgi:hypothetical protein
MGDFLASTRGRVFAALLVVAAIGAVGWTIWWNFGTDAAVADANDPIFIDAETGVIFHKALTAGMTYPVTSPDTGKQTGYEAELCYWTKDGHVKSDPTPVLLNIYRGIPGPTFCPDCGRLVVAHNPLAVEGHKPPPTEAEYRAAHGLPPKPGP